MRFDELEPADRTAIWRLLTRRNMRNAAALEKVLPMQPPLGEGDVVPIELDDEIDRLLEAQRTIDEDLELLRRGEVREDIVDRVHAIRDKVLVPLTDLGADLVYVEALARTGSATRFLWVARSLAGARPLRIGIGDVLRWELHPPIADGDAEALRRAALQLAMPAIHAAIAAPGFFDSADEVTIDSVSGTVDRHWDPERHYDE